VALAPRRTVLFPMRGFLAGSGVLAIQCPAGLGWNFPQSKIIGEAMKREREPFDSLVQVRMPRSMVEDLSVAAVSDLTSRSDLIRTTMADFLKRRGTEVAGAA
jgi:hypothetical protein